MSAARQQNLIWIVTRQRYIRLVPELLEASSERDLERQIQALADKKELGELQFDYMTDQVEVYSNRDGKRVRFATLVL